MNNHKQGLGGFTVSQWRLFFLVLVIGLLGFFYQILRRNDIDHSAALYVGLPFLFALGLSLSPKTTSTIGATMKGMSIALLLSAPVLMEGFICIIFAAPILYSVAAIVALVATRVKRGRGGSKLELSLLSLILALASLEGTHNTLSFNRDNQVVYSQQVNLDLDTVRSNLSSPALPGLSRPLLLKLFPAPVNILGGGLEVGDEQRLDFVYHKWFFTNTHRGYTVFRVRRASRNTIHFDIPHDTSYISHYLSWQWSRVDLQALPEGKTHLRWTLAYQRNLDPIWYFGPLQRYAVWLTAKVLVEHAARISQ